MKSRHFVGARIAGATGRARTSERRIERAVKRTRARVLALLPLAAGLTLAIGSCGDDQRPIVFCDGGGAAGSGAGGGVGGGAMGGTGGAAAGAGGAGVGGAGVGGAAGSIGGAGSGGRGGAAGNAGAAGAAGTGAAGRGGGGGGGAGGGGTAGTGGAGGIAGGGGSGGTTPTPGYTGCSHEGGVYLIKLTKQASAGTSGKCFDLVLWSSTQAGSTGVTLPAGWSVMSAAGRPCTGGGPSSAATTVTGTVTWGMEPGFSLPAVVNVNVTLGFAANDAGVPMTEAMNAQFVDVRAACP
jgi:hypothetical protein